ncbi:hypothetical protein [Arthrobacter sp. ISL-28]|uniref:hypothetical protein n=1 Tax=Arthrobacter sp. ISL-28 TaxID=2819108 RepID=UPI001BEA6DC2|nr:hypothetical protein [Arthrobacter sp. ISL-28]MBT2520790.1 hypothetical protein [Arthrobacter sp. ISL-28]
MESLTWFAPILPGKLEAFKRLAAETQGPRRDQYQQSRQRMGISREVVSHMATPQGDFACIFQEGNDIGKAFSIVANSEDPFDEWLREKLAEIHGITPEMLQAPPPATVHVNYRADA